MIEISIDPVAKPRMTQRDRWAQRPSVVAYWAYCEALRAECRRQRWALPDSVKIQFLIAMPPSWTKKKRLSMQGEPHRAKPDIDNLVKGILDALRPLDDSGVWRVQASKCWGIEGRVIMEAIDG